MGTLVDVIFDPVLKCYYEPKRHIYYQVRDVVMATSAFTHPVPPSGDA